MIREHIRKKVIDALHALNVEDVEVKLEHPSNNAYGDYATNVAMRVTKILQKSPTEVATDIANQITLDEVVEKIEVVKPGFINFWLKTPRLLKEVTEIIQKKDTYGTMNDERRTILLEFGGPNTHKLPHIGHLFSYVYGESLARSLEKLGNKVIRVNYQGDVGLHVAKCLYIVQDKWEEWKLLANDEEKVKFLQQCYQEGSSLYDVDQNAKNNIDTLNGKIYRKEADILEYWKETRELNIKYYEKFEDMLGIHYQKHYFESEVSDKGKDIVLKNVPKIFEESEGAIIFRGENYGLHTRVFINKLSNPTYEAKDIGLISMKIDDFKFDQTIVATANEQTPYWKVIKKASELVFPELEGKIKHLGFGMVQLTTGKMSSRTGNIIDAVSLVELVKSEIKRQFAIEDNELVETVALAAIKYSFLRSDIFSNISFDLEKSISREGDSGPYLLYTFVRCNSVLKEVKPEPFPETVILNEEEQQLIRLLYQFPEIVEQVGSSYSVHVLANYLFELAQRFNLFYQKHTILKADKDLKNFRIHVTAATAQILQNGLSLLGISVVEKM